MINKHYLKFKKGDTTEKWIYNQKTNRWKKANSSSYSVNYLDRFTRTVFSLLFVLFCSYLFIANFPFTGPILSIKKEESLLLTTWCFYILFVLLINHKTIASWKYFIFTGILTILMLFLSDMIMEQYNTIIYNYFLYSGILCIIYISITRYIRFLINRKEKKKKSSKTNFRRR